MNKQVLIVHSSRFGQSIKIAKAVQAVLEDAGAVTTTVALSKDTAIDPERYGALVLVESVRYGYFDRNAYRLIDRHRQWLAANPTLVMTVSLTARNPERRDPGVHSYTRKFLQKSNWTPTRIEVVAGALEYPRYHIFDRLAIQLIMRITKGVTDPSAVIEYTDWDQVDAAAKDFCALL